MSQIRLTDVMLEDISNTRIDIFRSYNTPMLIETSRSEKYHVVNAVALLTLLLIMHLQKRHVTEEPETHSHQKVVLVVNVRARRDRGKSTSVSTKTVHV